MTTGAAQRVVRRFLAADEKFDSGLDLGRYLGTHPETGWKKSKKARRSVDAVFLKRIAGIWFELSMFYGGLDVYLATTTIPKGIDMLKDRELWEEAHERLRVDMPGRGVTLTKIERKALELAKVYKELAGPRKKRDISGFRYWPTGTTKYVDDPLAGKEALQAWRKDVEKFILSSLTEGAGYGRTYKTKDLSLSAHTEYSLEEDLLDVDRRFVGRAVRAILDKLVKEGKALQLADGYWSVPV